VVTTTETRRPHFLAELLPGAVATVVAVGLSVLVNWQLAAVSALTVAVILGVAAGNSPVLPRSATPGLGWLTRRLLRGGVVLLGLQLAVDQVIDLGPGVIAAAVVTVAVGFLGTVALGRAIGVPHGLRVLVATGFSICGASAIAAMEGAVRRDDSDVATAVALVTFYGSLAIAAVPLLSPVLGLSPMQSGQWAGLSVQEVAQVVAAGGAAGAAPRAAATVVKLSRVALLAPMVAGVSLVERRHDNRGHDKPPLVPLFVLGFAAAVILRSSGVMPTGVLDVAKAAATIMLAAALFGLGTAVDIRSLVNTGGRALLLGLLSTVLVGATAWACLVAFV
jgi:uncharacterized integral membrane protein (TIGR00698 family)